MLCVTRVLLIALMITLLPLRGWAGEVMATEMASSQVVRAHIQVGSATKSGADYARIHWAKGTFEGKKTAFEVQKPLFEAKDAQISAMHDCEGHAKAEESTPLAAHCDSCAACQACHIVALSTTAVDLNLTFSSRALPRPAAAHFASATAALGQKPPIS